MPHPHRSGWLNGNSRAAGRVGALPSRGRRGLPGEGYGSAWPASYWSRQSEAQMSTRAGLFRAGLSVGVACPQDAPPQTRG